MKLPKKISLAQLPTPIELLKDFKHPAKIFLKRDDLTGYIISGNKARKAEYLFAQAKAQGADTIITCGANQSNHCRTIAACAAMLGLKTILLLTGKKPKNYEGNLLLDHLLDAKVIHVSPKMAGNDDWRMDQIAQALAKKGHKTYIIPVGGSNEIGLWGYIECMAEMKNFIAKQSIHAIYLPVGTGGTYAGLLLGKKLYNVKAEVHGVLVCGTIGYFKARIYDICQRTIERFNLKIKVDKDEISLIDGYAGKGYGIPYDEEVSVIREIAKQGVFIDPVYGGKAFYGMTQEITKNKRVIFLATGGIFSLFANNKVLFPKSKE